MTEYNGGFISSIIERSDQILKRNHYDVTRLLMLLSVGYAMVWERLKFHSNETEKYVSDPVASAKFEKQLGKSKCKNTLELGSIHYFENFCLNTEWEFFELPNYSYKYSIEQLLPLLNSEEKIDRSELKYSKLMRCIRNSLAHGGVHPLSPQQSTSFHSSNFASVRLGVGSNEHIDKIFFVSKNLNEDGKPIGFNIVLMSVAATYDFWNDWRKLLLKNDFFDYGDLDYAA